MTDWPEYENLTDIPTIHIISDSSGITAQSLARAVASQFDVTSPCMETCTKATSWPMIESFLETHRKRAGESRFKHMIVFYTLVDVELREKMNHYSHEHPSMLIIDLLSPALDAISQASGLVPSDKPGEVHRTDDQYFKRIEAMEFTIAHDDGANPQDLTKADIVLLGVSRCSKTPTSIYLSQQGYKVANVPLDLKSAPPAELYKVDSTRLFGLMTTPDVLVGIRKRRLGSAIAVASDYADPELVYEDLERARAFMRKLGCIVVHTENRAVEETAQEIIRYYVRSHPIHSR